MSTIIADQNTGWAPAPVVLGMPYGAATPNVWNIADALGFSEMVNIGGQINTEVNIQPSTLLTSGLKPEAIEYPIPILAYSEVIYGANNFGQVITPMATALQFPMTVDTFVSLGLSVHASTGVQTQDYYVDLLYDLWLKSDNTQRAVQQQDYEIMVLTLLRNSPYLGAPTALYFSLDTKMFGVPAPILWGIFLNRNPISGWTMVIWQPLFEQWLSLPNPNDLTLPLSEIILASQQVLNINLLNYYMMGIEFGSEFGLGAVQSYNYGWNLSDYYFQTANNTIRLL